MVNGMKQHICAIVTLLMMAVCGLLPAVCHAQWSADAGYSADSIIRDDVTDSSLNPSTLGSTYHNSSGPSITIMELRCTAFGSSANCGASGTLSVANP